MMGCGKTSAAINYMNGEPGPFIFVTPYLEECDRIVEGCTNKSFCRPSAEPSKLLNLHRLLRRGNDISSTHSLFSSYTPETVELVKNGGYTLVMDEAFEIIHEMKVSSKDIKELLKRGMITIDPDTYQVQWIDDEYEGTSFYDLMLRAKSGTLLYYDHSFLFWTFPAEVFKAFSKVIVLTYIFEAQVQKAYFDLYDIQYEKIGVHHVYGRQYVFDFDSQTTSAPPGLKDKIHILDKKKLNSVGSDDYSLSVKWFKSADSEKLRRLNKNYYNAFHNYFRAKKRFAMWSVFNDWEDDVRHDDYDENFVSFNQRAKNCWSHCRYLAYMVNVFMNPFLKRYFKEHGCSVDEDGYALSTMIQWIWRSAIRNGEDIYIYVPSRRMRELLENWIDAVTEGRDPLPSADNVKNERNFT